MSFFWCMFSWWVNRIIIFNYYMFYYIIPSEYWLKCLLKLSDKWLISLWLISAKPIFCDQLVIYEVAIRKVWAHNRHDKNMKIWLLSDFCLTFVWLLTKVRQKSDFCLTYAWLLTKVIQKSDTSLNHFWVSKYVSSTYTSRHNV